MSPSETRDAFTAGELGGGGVMVTRALRGEERPYPALAADVPLVIEARRGERLDALRHHLSRHSEVVTGLIYHYGAILLRGFPITSTQDFEETLFSIRTLRAMRGYFMAEPGRTRMSGSERIFHTNAFFKSGGTHYLGGFHGENYYSSDVPAFITFCCLKDPWMGGETGIVHMARAYEELGDPLKAKLQGEPSCARGWPISAVAKEYGLDEAAAERFCREVGFTIATMNGEEQVLLYKPNVFVHPVTGRTSLHINVADALRDLDDHLRESLSRAYPGPQWALYRLLWRHPRLSRTVRLLSQTAGMLHRPRELFAIISANVIKPSLASRRASTRPSDPKPPSACRLFDDDDTRSLGEAMCRHTSVFTWRRGDVLILDNLQMYHGGMPGFGPRRIEAALCNPLPIRWPLSSGVLRVCPEEGYESVFDRVMAQAERQRAPAPRGGGRGSMPGGAGRTRAHES
jgi:alpha-ketoglutarate-dependent taurine dioxygenase